MHTLRLTGYRLYSKALCMVVENVSLSCLKKVATFLHIDAICAFHFRSFDTIKPSNLADETTSTFLSLIVIGATALPDLCTWTRSTENHPLPSSVRAHLRVTASHWSLPSPPSLKCGIIFVLPEGSVRYREIVIHN